MGYVLGSTYLHCFVQKFQRRVIFSEEIEVPNKPEAVPFFQGHSFVESLVLQGTVRVGRVVGVQTGTRVSLVDQMIIKAVDAFSCLA